MTPENPFRDWLERDPYSDLWVPVARLGGWVAPLVLPVLFRARSLEHVLTENDWPLDVDSARPEVWEKHTGDQVEHGSVLHPMEERHGVLFHPFVAHFDPYTKPSWLEPIQPFLLHWKAWPEHALDGSVIWFDEDEESAPREIARWRLESYSDKTTVGRLEVRRDGLLEFLAVYDFDLAIYSDHRTEVTGLTGGWKDQGRGERRSWRAWASNISKRQTVAVLRDVCVLPKPPKDSVGQPWEREKAARLPYPIGTDRATGRPILATYPDTPFLTAVYFKESVLEKYLANPRVYVVEDSIVRGGRTWSLTIARTGRGTVHAWLGDVAELPESVQRHWQAYAVVDEGGVPEWRVRRDFRGEFADAPATGPLARLIAAMRAANAAAVARFGHPLYRDPDPLHAEAISVLRIPANPSMPAFAEQVRTLALLVVDHLNPDFLAVAGAPPADGTLNRLALLIQALTGRPESDSKQLIGGLYAVQSVRSSAVAHRTGARAREALGRAGISEHNLPAGFVRLVDQAAASIENVARVFRT